MPIRGTILLTWTFVYGFAALLYLLAFTRRRVEPELSRFGYLCVAFAVVSYARMQFILASSPDELIFAGNLAAAGRYLLGATFVSLCASISRVPSKLVPVASLWGGVGMILVLTGAHGDYDAATQWWKVRPAGVVMFGLGLVLGSAALLSAFRHRGFDPYVRRVVGAATVCFLAALVDATVAVLGYPRFDALAHAGVLGVILVHWTLLARFGEATEKLSDRREAYTESLEDLSQKHEQLLETEQLAAVGELSAVIAHEVRNPLAVIKNAASAIRRGAHGPDAQRKLLDILDEETERLHKLTFELGAFAEHGKPNVGECDLSAVLAHCVDRAKAYQDSSGGPSMRFETDAEVTATVADRELVESSLFYLVRNAMDASAPGATIRLTTRESDLDGEPAVEISVIDAGEGMSPETLEKATTPFFTTRSRGTGLALAIVHRIAKNHGGRLVIESRPGEGTTARIVLPRKRSSFLPSYTSIVPPLEESARA